MDKLFSVVAMNVYNYDIAKSQIEYYLTLFDELAMKHNPSEMPLIADNPYYKSAKMLEEKLFHIYYAYYGYGKTYGVGLKFYHEARAGELKHSYNVILINLREMLEHCNMFKDIVNKIPYGNSMTETLILASIYAAANIEKFLSRSECKSIYAVLDLDPVSRRTISQLILSGAVDRSKTIEIIERVVEKITERTQKKTVIIFDEFESTINYLVPNARLSEFLYEMGVLMRRLLDRGLKRLRVILLLQKAIFNEEERNSFAERLNKGYGFGPTAVTGIIVNKEIKSYQPNVYVGYIKEALNRLSIKLNEPKIISNTLHSIREDKFSARLKYLLRSLSKIPPRVAFPLIRKIVSNIALNGLKRRIKDIKELDDIVEKVMNEYISVNEILLYYFDENKIQSIGNDILSRASYIILDKIGREKKEDLFEVGGTYPGAVLLKRHSYDKKNQKLRVDVNILMARFKKLRRNSTIESMKNYIKKKYMNQVIQHILSLIGKYGKISELEVNIISVILKIPRVMLTPLQQAVEAAIEESIDSINVEHSSIKVNKTMRVLLHNLEEDMSIVLYYIGSDQEPSDETLKNYLTYRSEDLVNEIRTYFLDNTIIT